MFGDPAYLVDTPHWRISPVKDFDLFFEVLPQLVPGGSLLGLAGAFTSGELVTLLPQAQQVETVAPLPRTLPDEFRDAAFVPVTNETARVLREIEDRQLWPGFLLFVVVIERGQSILEWYDAPGDPIAVATSIPEAAVRDFAAATGSTYELVEHF